ncbi:MAG: hypothetical protein ACWGHH_06480 [Sulfurovaceae bacterium]
MNKIVTREDGNYEVLISFDITEHGHSFGLPRNYNLSKVQQLIRSKRVQDDIKNGYCLCMYGHGARAKEQGYLANERNEKTGEVQEPIGKITSLSIRDKIVSYTALLAVTPSNKTESVSKLIGAGIGGFSFVWNVPEGIFFGADYVLSPNFNGNRVITESLCGDGGCKLDSSISKVVADTIGSHMELFEEAKDLLEHQDSVMDAIAIKDKFKTLKEEIESLKAQVFEKDNIIENKKTENEVLEDNIGVLKRKIKKIDLDSIEAEKDTLKVELKTVKAELDTINAVLLKEGIMLDNGRITITTKILGDLLKPKKYNTDIDMDVIGKLKKPTVKQGDKLFNYLSELKNV